MQPPLAYLILPLPHLSNSGILSEWMRRLKTDGEIISFTLTLVTFHHSDGTFMVCETVHLLPVIFTDVCLCQSFVCVRLISPSLLFP